MQFHPNDLSDLDELTEEHLGFSALSDGLGFSKGKSTPAQASAPGAAAPHSAQPSSTNAVERQERTKQMAFSGTGAVAAGLARPAPGITAPRAPLATPAFTAATAAPTASQVLAEPAAPRVLRLTAFGLDALFVFVPLALAWLFSFGSASAEIFLRDPKVPLSLFTMIFGAYFLLSESFGGQSPGKMILGLRVVEDDKYQKPTGLKHATTRLGIFVLSGLCLGLGFFASFWDPKRRPWHDRYTGSIVRRKA